MDNDGAATKEGEKTGVATEIKTINGKWLYTHCYGHASNLAVADAIKSLQYISDSLKTVREIGKLVKKSSQRNTRTRSKLKWVLPKCKILSYKPAFALHKTRFSTRT